ncbi:LysR family transcriptional regulator [Actinopolymorpha alba]|uniref:LysR family transcriptional regulator n=1 Tax=Actinopolymorpha alba TaxID=533267 RepID=UPI0003758725|nr:LysR family transcriptional regulator [Actinopolymorpha alba]
MDVDTALLRAFVTTAEECHFGRAAHRLVLSQQALSKRIARLESLLGIRLFDRTRRRVELTAAGIRFLPYAREAVDAVDAAAAALITPDLPLTVDVLDEHLTALQLVRRALEHDPELTVHVTMREHRRSVVEGLRAGDFDVALGRAGAVDQPWPADVRRRPLFLERVALLLAATDPLAARAEIPLAELRGVPLWFPAIGAPEEWISYLREFAGAFGLDIDYSGSTMGMELFIDRIRTGDRRGTFYASGMPAPPDSRLRVVPLGPPAPVFAWWAMWRRRIPDQVIDRLVASMVDDLAEQWAFAADPARGWLPAADRACLASDLDRGNASERANWPHPKSSSAQWEGLDRL